jgi:hypothetical protein
VKSQIAKDLKRIEQLFKLDKSECLADEQRYMLLADAFTVTNSQDSKGAPILTQTMKIKRNDAHRYFAPVAH